MPRKIDPMKYYLISAIERKREGIQVEGVTLKTLQTLWSKQKGKCAYTGMRMHLPAVPQDSGKTVRFGRKVNLLFAASLDRIDSSKPYRPDNIHFVCRMVNLGKSEVQDKEVREFFRRYRRLVKKGIKS